MEFQKQPTIKFHLRILRNDFSFLLLTIRYSWQELDYKTNALTAVIYLACLKLGGNTLSRSFQTSNVSCNDQMIESVGLDCYTREAI